ncbi:hypothetical protein HRS9139_05156 [Pyrenophora teres f. teres]|uniref:Uncharacterized protein n=1 Tax=Pyrenophora teres f. teres TaxID=97479 RepID=A0A6S6W262_9PLEO|nr:hypothetical protein HRS9139_05156 [Pyrenophora teres f. teres]KAE8848968.1 hypothetical protein HRS9122_02984 [Pyrenophora teres f. teres]CAE7031239.1 hypothetical protein PTTW11_04764 [Pyrenophora teres f. teres]
MPTMTPPIETGDASKKRKAIDMEPEDEKSVPKQEKSTGNPAKKPKLKCIRETYESSHPVFEAHIEDNAEDYAEEDTKDNSKDDSGVNKGEDEENQLQHARNTAFDIAPLQAYTPHPMA